MMKLGKKEPHVMWRGLGTTDINIGRLHYCFLFNPTDHLKASATKQPA